MVGRITYTATQATPLRSPYGATLFYALTSPWGGAIGAGDAVDILLDWGYTSSAPTYKDDRTLTSSSSGVAEVRHFNTSVSHKFSVAEIIETYGTEIMRNGTFESDALFTKGTGWTIGSGVATSDGTQTAVSSLTSDTATAVSGMVYATKITLSQHTSGSVTLRVGGTDGTARTALGTFSEDITAAGTIIEVQASADFVGSIDDVSVVLTGTVSEFAVMNALNDEMAKGTMMKCWPDYAARPSEYYSIIGNRRIAPKRSQMRQSWKFDFDVMVLPGVQAPSTVAAFVSA